MRRFGAPPRPGLAYRRRPGAYAILMRGGEVLVTEERGQVVEIQLPGGGIDPGEGPLEALHREVREETGWRIADVQRLGVYQRYVFMPDYDIFARKICHVYVARPVRPLGPPTEPNHRAVWMAPGDAVGRLASPGDAWFLRQLILG